MNRLSVSLRHHCRCLILSADRPASLAPGPAGTDVSGPFGSGVRCSSLSTPLPHGSFPTVPNRPLPGRRHSLSPRADAAEVRRRAHRSEGAMHVADAAQVRRLESRTRSFMSLIDDVGLAPLPSDLI